MLENLKKLLTIIDPSRITLRVPLIPEFNTAEDQQRSKAFLCGLGVTQFDLFTYKTSP